jgi:sulfate-transporting ATPase
MENHGSRLGSKVIEVNNVCKAFGSRNLMDDVSFSVPPGSIVGKSPEIPAQK